jgi:uroporphyrinogen-III synthase
MNLQFAAIGKQTAEYLGQLGIKVELTPARQDSEGLAEALISKARHQSLLLVRGDRGSSVLTKRLMEAYIQFHEVVVYRSIDITHADPLISRMLAEGKMDWVIMTSSTIAQASVNLWGNSLRKCKLASISPTTSGKLAELGFRPTVEASSYSLDGLIRAILQYETDSAA